MRDTVISDCVWDGLHAFVAMDYDLKAARQCPQKLEGRDIEGNAGYGEPDPGSCADYGVHARKEIQDVAVFDHHAFGFSRGARGVDDVGEILFVCGRANWVCAARREFGGITIDKDDAACS